MSGRLAALWQIFWYTPYVIGAAASGYFTEHLSPRTIFVGCGLVTFAIALCGLWKPSAVFAGAYDRPQARRSGFIGDIRRLVCHRAVYPAVLILFVFQFAPGQNTPLQYYLTNQLHAPDSTYGNFYAIFTAAFIPMMFIYGWLCKRFPLRTLLWVGTIITIPQNLPLAFMTTGNQALVIAAIIGFLGGLATGAYYDLAMRSCPPGLQGTLMMLIESGQQISYRGGDWLGTKIFEASPARGFFWCVIVTTLVYVLIVPLLFLIPKQLIATAEGEPNPLLDAPPDAPAPQTA
jgi:MFS family permease